MLILWLVYIEAFRDHFHFPRTVLHHPHIIIFVLCYFLYSASISFIFTFFIISFITRFIKENMAQTIFLLYSRGCRYSSSQDVSSFYSCGIALVHFSNNFYVFLANIISLHGPKNILQTRSVTPV